MGILDDAIREHLELKRRRGADPAEIERLEREALGPVRRGAESSEPPLDQLASAPDGVEEGWTLEPPGRVGHEDWELEENLGHQARQEHEPAADWPPAAGETDSPAPRPEVPPAAAHPPPARAGGGSEHEAAGGETAEYDVEIGHEVHGREGEDVLEETPEFLQDTPDHDRLWFEQRPPRDFDFDG